MLETERLKLLEEVCKRLNAMGMDVGIHERAEILKVGTGLVAGGDSPECCHEQLSFGDDVADREA